MGFTKDSFDRSTDHLDLGDMANASPSLSVAALIEKLPKEELFSLAMPDSLMKFRSNHVDNESVFNAIPQLLADTTAFVHSPRARMHCVVGKNLAAEKVWERDIADLTNRLELRSVRELKEPEPPV